MKYTHPLGEWERTCALLAYAVREPRSAHSIGRSLVAGGAPRRLLRIIAKYPGWIERDGVHRVASLLSVTVNATMLARTLETMHPAVSRCYAELGRALAEAGAVKETHRTSASDTWDAALAEASAPTAAA